MASGFSNRMGQNKLLMKYNDKFLIEHTLNIVSKCNFKKKILVTQYEEIKELGEKLNYKVVINNSPNKGQSESIKLGVKNSPKCDGYMFFVGDQPLLNKDDIEKLVKVFKEDTNYIVIPKYKDKCGNPVIYPIIYKEQILNGIGNGLITFDKNGVITTLNKSCESLLNINSEEFIGMRYDEVGLENYINVDHLRECLKFEKQFSFQEKRYYKDNKENILSYILKPLFDLNNENIGAVITFNDITEISMLRKRLAENDKMNSLGTLISRMSHEIRNPLTSIKAYIDLLPIKYENVEFRKKITTEIPTEIERLNGLLTDLIDYSKPKKLKKENFDIVQLVNQIIDIFASEIESKGIDINYLDKSQKFLYADMQQIKQIIINILRNSIDAIKGDGVIRIDMEDRQEEIILSILDNGRGIADDDFNNIFDPFFTTKDNGTGLGLAICYQYAKENNANINIDSKYGEWTKVELIFMKS